jgi:hypothetical protein
MKKHVLLVVFSIILAAVVLSGCDGDQTATETDEFGDIEFESDIVELVHGQVVKKIDEGILIGIDVEYLFKNIADRDIEVKVNLEFYDKDDNIIFRGGPKWIVLPDGYTETQLLGANIISYNGKYTKDVDHVKIIAVED